MNLASDIKFYVITHLQYPFLDSDVIFPIATNKELGDRLNILSSEENNEMFRYNDRLAEFSTMHWVWKNDYTSRYVGFFHYRRYLLVNDEKKDFNQLVEPASSCGFDYPYLQSVFNNYDVIVSNPQVLWTTLYNQYASLHQIYLMDKALDFISRKYPHYRASFDTALASSAGYFCNLFIMKREYFNEYMTFLFSLFEEIKDDIIAAPQVKPFAYLGERLLSGYIEYLKRSAVRVKEVPVLEVRQNDCIIRHTTGF